MVRTLQPAAGGWLAAGTEQEPPGRGSPRHTQSSLQMAQPQERPGATNGALDPTQGMVSESLHSLWS